MKNAFIASAAALLAAVAAPGVSHAAPASFGDIFMDASVVPKIFVVSLIVATLSALVVCGLKLASGPRLTGGSAFISGLRIGGPLIGCLGAAYVGLLIAIGLANAPTPPTMVELAPGIAELLLPLALGLLSGTVAVLAHWAIEARIDRTVLSA